MPQTETSLLRYLSDFASSYSDGAVFWLILLIVILFLIGFGALLTQWRTQRIITALKERNAELSITLQLEQRSHAEKLSDQRQDRVQLNHAFNSLASRALRHNNETFLKLARENLQQFQLQASNELAQKEQAVENLVNPIKEALEKNRAPDTADGK